ncbi:hypothetical protein HanRHA438_Chr04g0187301 [Helianthus annuus]|nr:hypothetical protein HanRHA438_Chr04g0187301 [Helianthus annuus]
MSSLFLGGQVLRVEVGFPRIWESQGVGSGRVVDLGHSARCYGGWHVVPCCSKKKVGSPCVAAESTI